MCINDIKIVMIYVTDVTYIMAKGTAVFFIAHF